MSERIKDPRFNSIHHDPRFIKPNNKQHRNKSKTTTEQEEPIDNRFTTTHDSTQKKKKNKSKSIEIPKVIDYARGRVILESSDEDEEDEDIADQELESDSDSEEDVELGPGSKRNRRQEEELEIDLNEDILEEEEGLQKRIEEEEESRPQIHPTRRIAVVNLDWDHLKPIDIYKVFSSVLSVPIHSDPQSGPAASTGPARQPTDKQQQQTGRLSQRVEGRVERVQVYKSQFGKERMRREDEEGPPAEIFKTSSSVPFSHEDQDQDQELVELDNGAEFDDKALRQYQLDRLRYFYAIVSLDSTATAQHVFAEIDGTEFERTANIFDLSYVPEEMEFDEADLADECDADTNDYQPLEFSTDVLRHSKVKLTWDNEDPIRKKYTRLNTQKLTQEELDELDFGRFIAPGSSDEEPGSDGDGAEDEDVERGTRRRKAGVGMGDLRKKLGLVADEPAEIDDGELEISFKPGFVDRPLPTVAASDPPAKSKNQRIKEKLKAKPESPAKPDDQHHARTARGSKSDREKREADELALLMVDDLVLPTTTHPDPKSVVSARHFDLTKILKHEKLSAMKSKLSTKSRRKLVAQLDGDPADQLDRFQVDVDDPRFGPGLVRDPEFAIDPSNPQFIKSKNMLELLDSTRAKRARPLTPSSPSIQDNKNNKDGDGERSMAGEENNRSVEQLLSHLKKPPLQTSKRARIG
ncbi:hypothetical protein PGTUg99_032628 [Puccinia graminis f. sp. tritici]|uniref:Uncharacterized protein n=1 Tax=Puccinia graminis f. sp. tritici TaxID=56615 RepID=A0A5B0QS70_PUCGR|nr:hypothetical protein PGTUg99_032628 [Puccinia graminis f. sp. tritici]